VIFVEQTGPLALIEDLGRPGLAHLGVSPSGAADRASSALANRLVGNPETAAVIEVTLGGLIIVARHFHWAAITGPLTQLWINQQPATSHAPFVLHPGDRLRVDPPADGIRNYLAVRGGLQVPEVLGSRATDVLSGLGPEPLQSGVSIVVGHATGSLPGVDLAPPHPPNKRLAVLPGPRRDWFTDQAWSVLQESLWTVSAEADRVAVRLEGPRLDRRIRHELPSEGLIRGAIQVPSAGQPLIFLADHPVTGGYPVIGVLTDRAADDAAQLRPGDQVSLHR
jgi:biotin-dependent carboxylase-like uncharacterized protein